MNMDEESRDDRHDRDDDQDREHGKPKTIAIEVNGRDVEMTKEEVTGLEIKEAAIAQGVNIQPTFVLQQELPNGSSKIIGDRDKVQLRKHLRFTAIAPDDNS
jgi:Multiubiquitin